MNTGDRVILDFIHIMSFDKLSTIHEIYDLQVPLHHTDRSKAYLAFFEGFLHSNREHRGFR
jgi:hypothetical protein